MRGGGLRAYALIYLLFLYTPILLLPIFAFNSGTIIAFPLKGFTTEWFAQMVGNASLRKALTNSLVIAFSAAILSTCLGTFAARASTRFRFPGKGAAMGMLPGDIDRWHVRNSAGAMVPFTAFATASWASGSPRLERYNGVPSVEILGMAMPGAAS